MKLGNFHLLNAVRIAGALPGVCRDRFIMLSRLLGGVFPASHSCCFQKRANKRRQIRAPAAKDNKQKNLRSCKRAVCKQPRNKNCIWIIVAGFGWPRYTLITVIDYCFSCLFFKNTISWKLDSCSRKPLAAGRVCSALSQYANLSRTEAHHLP